MKTNIQKKTCLHYLPNNRRKVLKSAANHMRQKDGVCKMQATPLRALVRSLRRHVPSRLVREWIGPFKLIPLICLYGNLMDIIETRSSPPEKRRQ